MKKFRNKKTGEIATYKDGVLKSSGFSVEIGVEPSSEFWEELKSPLFKSEDGVDIYEGDDYYTIFVKDYLNRKAFDKVNGPFKADDLAPTAKQYLNFYSTLKAAQEFIILNKPCLSINDVFEHTQMFNLRKWGEVLKELVKSKL